MNTKNGPPLACVKDFQAAQWLRTCLQSRRWVWCQGGENSLEEGMATRSSNLAWKIPRTVEPRGLQSGVTEHMCRLSGSDDSENENICLFCVSWVSASASHSVVPDSATPWTAVHQAPLSMRFSRLQYWSGLRFPSPGDLPTPGIEPGSPALQARTLPTELQGKPRRTVTMATDLVALLGEEFELLL